MPLSPEPKQLEHEWRIYTMTVGADYTRLNMDKLRSDLKYESRKFMLQAIVVAAALLGSGAAVGGFVVNYLDHHPATVIITKETARP
jgi:hypothetical protein